MNIGVFVGRGLSKALLFLSVLGAALLAFTALAFADDADEELSDIQSGCALVSSSVGMMATSNVAVEGVDCICMQDYYPYFYLADSPIVVWEVCGFYDLRGVEREVESFSLTMEDPVTGEQVATDTIQAIGRYVLEVNVRTDIPGHSLVEYTRGIEVCFSERTEQDFTESYALIESNRGRFAWYVPSSPVPEDIRDASINLQLNPSVVVSVEDPLVFTDIRLFFCDGTEYPITEAGCYLYSESEDGCDGEDAVDSIEEPGMYMFVVGVDYRFTPAFVLSKMFLVFEISDEQTGDDQAGEEQADDDPTEDDVSDFPQGGEGSSGIGSGSSLDNALPPVIELPDDPVLEGDVGVGAEDDRGDDEVNDGQDPSTLPVSSPSSPGEVDADQLPASYGDSPSSPAKPAAEQPSPRTSVLAQTGDGSLGVLLLFAAVFFSLMLSLLFLSAWERRS